MLKTAAKVIKIVENKHASAAFFTETPTFAPEMRNPGKYYTAIAVLGTVLGAACTTSREVSEDEAVVMLQQARELLADGCFASARDTILSMRKQYPTALQTRRQAILTLDSIELLETRDSLQRYELSLQAARDAFSHMRPRLGGKTNEQYYQQQRLLFEMEQHYDELCAKAKFYLRKIDIDQLEQ